MINLADRFGWCCNEQQKERFWCGVPYDELDREETEKQVCGTLFGFILLKRLQGSLSSMILMTLVSISVFRGIFIKNNFILILRLAARFFFVSADLIGWSVYY